MEKVKISSEAIKRALKKKKYAYTESIAEYIWNGFDAKASEVKIIIKSNEIGSISELAICDNGHGITSQSKFEQIFESEKEIISSKSSRSSSVVHGENGIGRLTFFTFANSVTWHTVYEDINTKEKFKYTIKVTSDALDGWKASEPIPCDDEVGTTVVFSNIHTITYQNFEGDIQKFLFAEFAWFLELNFDKKYLLTINGKKLNYRNEIIGDTEEYKHFIDSHTFNIKFIRWNKRLNNEYSRFYLIDSTGDEKLTNTTTLNNKADRFFHSIYVRSSFFNGIEDIYLYEKTLFRGIEGEVIYSELKKFIDLYLRKKRKPFLKKASDELVESFENKGIFPVFSNDTWQHYRKVELKEVLKEIYQAEPKIFSDLSLEQKKIFVHFLNLIIDSGERDRLFNILGEIISLDSGDLDQLAKSLKTAKLSNMIKTIKLIEDRFAAIEDLRRLVFDTKLKAKESHIQKFIENHYWIFGEQYHLVTAEEPKFEEALRRYVYHLRGEKPAVSIDHPDKLGEMDIFMVRKLTSQNLISNIVVELKRPEINLGEKELSQVKKYMRVILSQDEFNASNRHWTFILVGNGFDTTGYMEDELLSKKSFGEKHLVFSTDRYKIYVMRWSEVFTEFEVKHHFLYEKLQIERDMFVVEGSTANEIVAISSINSAVQPSAIAIPE